MNDERTSTELNKESRRIVDRLVGDSPDDTLCGTVIFSPTVEPSRELGGRFTCGKGTLLQRLAPVLESTECTVYVQGSPVSLTQFLLQDLSQLGEGAWVVLVGEPSFEFPEDCEIHEALRRVAQLKRDAEAAHERELSAAFERLAAADDGTLARFIISTAQSAMELQLTRQEFMEIPGVRQGDRWVFVDNLLVSPDEFADIEWGADITIRVIPPLVGGF